MRQFRYTNKSLFGKPDFLGDLGVDGRIILKWILIDCETVSRIQLGQNMMQWPTVVNEVMNIRVS
jgi:hypothetical protein